MARAYYQLFCVYFLRFRKARASIILYSTFQVLVVVGVCNQLIWYLDSNILKPATVVRVFFSFFFQTGDNSSSLDCVDSQGAEKMETTQIVQIDL